MNAIVFVAPQGGFISSHFMNCWCLWRVEFALPAAPARPKSWHVGSGTLNPSQSLTCQLFGPNLFSTLSHGRPLLGTPWPFEGDRWPHLDVFGDTFKFVVVVVLVRQNHVKHGMKVTIRGISELSEA